MAVTDPPATGAMARVRPQGSPELAFDLERLYRKHHRLVFCVVRSGVPSHVVEDLVQEVFIAAHRRRQRCPAHPHAQRKWILGVARSVVHTHRRSAARRVHQHLDLPESPLAASLEDQLHLKTDLERFQRILHSLEPHQRETYLLVELEGLSAVEAAQTLGVKLNTIYSRLRLAREKVSAALGSSPDLEHLRRVALPSPEQRRRTWALVAAHLGAPVLSGPKLLAAVALASALTSVTVTSIHLRATHPPPRPEVLSASSNAILVPSLAPPPIRPWVPHWEPQPRPEPPRARMAPSPLDQESDLLRRAALELDRGDPRKAARQLQRHARRFPSGQLAAERERLMQRMAQLTSGTVAPASP